MVSVYNRNAHNQGLSTDFMTAKVGNLLDPADPLPADFASEAWFNFDLTVVGLGFHHFEDPKLAAARLAERLRPGGVLMIIDFMPHAHHGEIEVEGRSGSGNGEGNSHHHEHGHSLFHGHNHEYGHGDHGHGNDGTEASQEPIQDSNQIENDKKFKEVMHTIAHAGFSKDEVYTAFEKAGVGKDFAFDVLKKDIVFRTSDRKITRQVFFARGTKT
jgi:SAM-dependent methyltransferase